jgi:hypothetical protein
LSSLFEPQIWQTIWFLVACVHPEVNHKWGKDGIVITIKWTYLISVTWSVVIQIFRNIDIEIDNEGRFETKLYYKGDDFSYPIMNFQFIYKATLHQHLHMEYIYLSITTVFYHNVNVWGTHCCDLLYFKMSGMNAINIITKLRTM